MVELLKEKIDLQKEFLELKHEQIKLDMNNNYLQSFGFCSATPFETEPQVSINEKDWEAIEAQINATLPETIDDTTLITASTKSIITSTLNVADESYALND